MKPSEYLDAAKTKMGIESDYELAKRLDFPRQSIPGVREGKRPVPTEMAFKLAITLEMDPATVIADLEAQREKNPKKREFFLHFMRHAAVVAVLGLTLGWSSIAGYERAAAALGGLSALAATAAFSRPRKFA